MLQEFDFIWLREDNGGLLWGSPYEEAPRLAFVEDDPPDRFDQLPLDGVEKVRRDGENASRAIPLLARYRSLTVAQGAPCYTPDLRGMVGPVPGITASTSSAAATRRGSRTGRAGGSCSRTPS